jgi:hypothetical protein
MGQLTTCWRRSLRTTAGVDLRIIAAFDAKREDGGIEQRVEDLFASTGAHFR